jgi:hypothetical protein
VKEIWLTSEDTGAYGRDINTNIAVLLKEICEQMPKDMMLRVRVFLYLSKKNYNFDHASEPIFIKLAYDTFSLISASIVSF